MFVPKITISDTDYMKVVQRATHATPVLIYREMEIRKNGTWFFGLFNRYVYEWSEWKEWVSDD